MHYSTERIIHTTAFSTPVMEHYIYSSSQCSITGAKRRGIYTMLVVKWCMCLMPYNSKYKYVESIVKYKHFLVVVVVVVAAAVVVVVVVVVVAAAVVVVVVVVVLLVVVVVVVVLVVVVVVVAVVFFFNSCRVWGFF